MIRFLVKNYNMVPDGTAERTLIFGRWRTENEVNTMSDDDKRSTVIVGLRSIGIV